MPTIIIERHLKETLRNETDCCYNCRHYHQHFVENHIGDWVCFDEIYSGHCGYPRLKSRKPYDVCDNFERRHAPDFPTDLPKGESR